MADRVVELLPNESILFLGTSTATGRGGVAYVLDAYKQIFPLSTFISTTASSNKIINLVYLLGALIRFVLLLTFSKKIKIIHIHGASYNSFKRKYIFFKLAKFYEKKVIYHIHGGEFHLFFERSSMRRKQLIRDFMENADYVICISEWWKRYFISKFKIKNIGIVPNVVIPPTTRNEKEKNIRPERLSTFLFLGDVAKHKGIWFLLDVIRNNISQIRSKAKFYIGGDGEINLLKLKIQKYKLDDIVEYIGWVTDEKKDYYLRTSDVYLLPSYNEGLPISILEAMSYGLPILATNVGGIPEIVSDDNGKLFNPGNSSELKEMILYFINAELRKMGEISYAKANKYFPDQIHKVLIGIYEHLGKEL